MSDHQTPEEQLAQVALAALSEGLYAFEHDKQLQTQQLREQLDQLGEWAKAHNDPDGRMLPSVAMALRLLSNGGITDIVRRIAATLCGAQLAPRRAITPWVSQTRLLVALRDPASVWPH